MNQLQDDKEVVGGALTPEMSKLKAELQEIVKFHKKHGNNNETVYYLLELIAKRVVAELQKVYAVYLEVDGFVGDKYQPVLNHLEKRLEQLSSTTPKGGLEKHNGN